MTAISAQSWIAVLIVLALVSTLAYLLRRGAFGTPTRKGRVIQIETAVPLGERRSLVIVVVEGRRLLLGLTPAQVSMVAELAPPAFESQLDGRA